MITFFTIPKPFLGLYNIIQRNAILSWQQAVADCEILVFGDDPSIKTFCDDVGVTCIEKFKKNTYGTPLLGNIYETVNTKSCNDLICFINTDIILLSGFAEKIKSIELSEFLIAGRRWDLDFKEIIDFKSEWENKLRKLVSNNGILHRETGVDYFLFPKTIIPQMPEFAIGRAWWDNWLLYYFKSKSIPLIDGTEIMTIHQNHDYSHVQSVTSNSTSKGIERNQNQAVAKIKYWNIIYISDASYILNNGELIKVSIKHKLARIYSRYILGTISELKNIVKKYSKM